LFARIWTPLASSPVVRARSRSLPDSNHDWSGPDALGVWEISTGFGHLARFPLIRSTRACVTNRFDLAAFHGFHCRILLQNLESQAYSSVFLQAFTAPYRSGNRAFMIGIFAFGDP